MARRKLLRGAVKTGLFIGCAAFAGAFIHGMLRPGPVSADAFELAGMAPGTARLASWEGTPVWVVRRSASQLGALARTSPQFIQSGPAAPPLKTGYRSLREDYGIYLAETARTGILVQFTPERPAGLDPATPWEGGFVDPATGALFDTAGRRYNTTRGADLEVPPHRYEDAGTIRLGAW